MPNHGLRYRVGRVGHVPPNIFTFNTTPMGVAWKELTPEGLRPPQYLEGGEALVPNARNRCLIFIYIFTF